MTKQLIDIAKEQGAIVEYKYINKDIPKELKQLTFTEAQLQATINAYNAQNKGTLECRFTYLIDELKKLLGLDENYMLLSSAPIESKLISLLEEKLNAANAQESDPVGYVSSIPISNPAAIRKDKNESLSIPVFAAPKTLPPEWAEYVGRLEGALDVCKYDCNTGEVIGIAQEAISSKPKDR